MENRKRVSTIFILLLCSLCGGFSREKNNGLGRGWYNYKYSSMKEFYEYWDEAASVSTHVCINKWDFPFKQGNLVSISSPDGQYIFYYDNGQQTLEANFVYVRYGISGEAAFGTPPDGKWFRLPEDYDKAVSYWNARLKNM